MQQSNNNKLNEAVNLLNQKWGHTDFRPLQGDIINSVVNKKNTIVLLPTGGGKSICYQIPSPHARRGVSCHLPPISVDARSN